jgi:hypothetical protein
MHKVIFLWDGVRAYHHFQLIPILQKVGKVSGSGARGIANQQSRRQMNDRCPVVDHLFRRGFYIPAWATATGRKAHQLHFLLAIARKCPFPIPQSSQTFTPGTVMVAVTNNDAQSNDRFRDRQMNRFFRYRGND